MQSNYIKKTKIIATIWPSTRNEDMILKLYKAWVNVLRFNFSHADYENAAKVWQIVKQFNKDKKTKLWLMLDTKWPEIRTGDYDGTKKYTKWDIFNIYVDKSKVAIDNWDSRSILWLSISSWRYRSMRYYQDRIWTIWCSRQRKKLWLCSSRSSS